MPTDWPDYELIDFGDGRKLERFGPWVLDRPCPAAETKKKRPALWDHAIARFEGDRAGDGVWITNEKSWTTSHIDFPVRLSERHHFCLQLAPLPSGQIGIFFEQFANWQWIVRQVQRLTGTAPKSTSRKVIQFTYTTGETSKNYKRQHTPRVLNLFAYTGASTLAAAAARAEVTHVDAAKSVVSRAKENAKLSGLEDAPIRWIVEDALKFCQREVKRGSQYDAVILDPPSYGHGPKGEEWSIKRDLFALLKLCGELAVERRSFVLCTCHTPSIGPAELSAYLSDGLFGHCGQQPNSGKLYLQIRDGRKLESGVFARWPA